MHRLLGWMLAALSIVVVAAVLVWQHLSAQAAGASALLFDYVTNQKGLDTGIVIANASLPKFRSIPKAGTCLVFYYGSTLGGGAPPNVQVTQLIPPGGQLVFNLSSGGNYGILATPGFEGYMIVFCNFPFSRGAAVVTDLSAQRFFAPMPAKVLPGF